MLFVHVYVRSPFKPLNQLTVFHEISYKCYAIDGHSNTVLF
jgi:hypothetical protein